MTAFSEALDLKAYSSLNKLIFISNSIKFFSIFEVRNLAMLWRKK
jgi:hypothetical protein